MSVVKQFNWHTIASQHKITKLSMSTETLKQS